MAVVNKNFVIKNGLVVEGTTATVNGSAILTKSTADQNYIIGLIGGSATSEATANSVVLRDANGSFAANVITADVVGDVTGNVKDADGNIVVSVGTTFTATDFTGNLTGDVTGNVTGDVTGTVSDISNHTTTNLTEGTNLYFTDARAVTANQGLWDAAGSASAAQAAAEGYADGLAVNYDPAGSAANALADAQAYTDNAVSDINTTIGNLNTDDVTELSGATNLWYTDARARASLSAGQGIGYNSTSGQIYIDNTVTATKTYVDSVAQGLDVKESVRVATTGNISFATSVGDIIDGVTLADGDRILLKSQNNAAENGIYQINASAVITRTTDADEPAELNAGTFVFVEEGTTYGDTGWVVSSNNPIIIGNDPMNWTQFSGAGTYLAGNGLTLSGNEFAIDGTVVATQTDLETTANTLSAQIDALSASVGTDYATISYVDAQDVITLGSANEYTDNVVGALTTFDVPEGTGGGEYFTATRAEGAIANAIAAGSHQNITITYNGATNSFDFVAENGVADSTTDDLAEGTTNLYFAPGRVLPLLSATAPVTYDSANGVIGLDSGNGLEVSASDLLVVKAGDGITVDANGVAVDSTVTRENSDAELNTLTLGGTVNGPVKLGSYLKTTQSGIQATLSTMSTTAHDVEEVIVKVASTTDSEVTKLLIAVDSSGNIAVTEYGTVSTAASSLITSITPRIDAANLLVLDVVPSVDAEIKVSWTAL